MILLLDNYDSFTYNLYQYLGELGAEVEVVRNDVTTPEEIIAAKPAGIVISPGPCTPSDAGISLDLIAALEKKATDIPLLGVCLGHQCMAQHFGATVNRAPTVMHGKLSQIEHNNSGVFANLPSPFTATRYHSLIAIKGTVPDTLEITAWTNDDLIMGLQHKELPYHGVQFHPESILSPDGKRLLANFLRIAGLEVDEPERVEIDWPMTVQ